MAPLLYSDLNRYSIVYSVYTRIDSIVYSIEVDTCIYSIDNSYSIVYTRMAPLLWEWLVRHSGQWPRCCGAGIRDKTIFHRTTRRLIPYDVGTQIMVKSI